MATYVALFLLDSNNWFFICLVPYIYICLCNFLILCFYFHLLFHALLATRKILQFTIFDSISLQPSRNITEIKEYFIVHYEWKSVVLIITDPMHWYFRGAKYEFFLPLYQFTFFLVFDQATDQKIFFSSCSHITF